MPVTQFFTRRPLMIAFISGMSMAMPARAASPPVVNATTPVSGATGVPTVTAISATFSQAMNPATITSTSFKLEKLGTGVMTLSVTETGKGTSVYTFSQTSAPYAGMYRGTYGGDDSGTFYVGVSGTKSVKGFTYNSSDDDNFSTTLTGSSSPWSFSATSPYGTHIAGKILAGSTSGTWSNSGDDGTFSGTKLLGNDGSSGYAKTVFTSTGSYWIGAAEINGGIIKGAFVDTGEPDLYYGEGTVNGNGGISIPTITSQRYHYTIGSATGTVSMATSPVGGSISYNSATHTATFTPTSALSPLTTYRATIGTGVKDASGTPLATAKSWSFTTGQAQKTLSVAISGNGEVDSDPAGIDCGSGTTGSCVHAFSNGETVTLTATEGTGSLFDGWSGACSGMSGKTCPVAMTADRSVGANFILSPLVRLYGGGAYGSLQAAYNASATDCTIQARAVELPAGNFSLNRDMDVVLAGGYDTSYSSNSGGCTTMVGNLSLNRGTLEVENLIVR